MATPEIKTVAVPAAGSARILVCTDGVWDVFDSVKAIKSIKGFGKAETAAKKICPLARGKREYGGLSMDDISAVVIDIGKKRDGEGGGAGGCFCMRPPA